MNQTNIIIGSIVVGFFIFITVKGELPAYVGVIGLGSDVASAPSTGTSSTPTSTVASQIAPTLATAASSATQALGGSSNTYEDSIGG